MAQSSSSASVEEESQAAQILAQLLETQQTDGDQLQALQDSERSEDCYKRNTMPATRYHTNGLGHTQTDSQFSGEGPETCQIQVEEEEGSSQKENMNSSLTNESSGSIPGLTWSKRATKGTEETVERNTSAATKGHTSKFNSRSSPRRGRGNKSSPKHSLSQDSFIGPASNPAEAYIATSRHFNIPLSQLAESSEETQQNMYRYQSGPQYNPKPPNLGNVLVDDTPPNSGGEESQSQEERVKPQSVDHNAPPRQHFEDLDVDVDAEPDPQSQSRQPSSQGSSQGASQMKFWEDQANGKNWEPTQSTQPEQSQSDPVSEWDTIMEQLREMKVRVAPYYTNMNAIRRPASGTCLSPRAVPRTVVRVATNQHLWRKASVTAIHGGDTDDWEETQVNTQLLNDSSPPSPLEDESHLVPGLLSTRPPPPCPKPPPPQLFDSEPTQLVTEQPVDHSCLRRQLPASRSTKGSVQTPCERRRPTVSIDPDAMDIVPDSEPPVASPQRTFTETTPSVRSKDLPSKKEDHSMDIVPDSEEPRAPSLEPLTEEEGEDDDSDDVPLNALVKGSRKVKGLTSAEAMPPPPTTTRQGKGKATPAGKGKGKAKAAPPKPARTASPAVATSRRSNRRTRATEDEVVPSSVPEETPKPKRPKRGASRATPGSSRKKRRTETDDEVIKTEPDATDDGATTEATADEDTVPSTLKRKLQRSTVEPLRLVRNDLVPPLADASRAPNTDNTGNYVVEFSDKSSASLTLEHIRRCELRIGDEVLWEEEMIGWKVTAWQGEAEETIVSLELEGA
ncbi:hypothetical protein VNI00_003243 [Paramarasmius palmivorus]|uniref:Uncharacterized protein n=1 Tax=Paramarasmius palmivorus TaxID=297713 RepID=A0AAW0DUJ8_9AGAR